MCPQKKDKDMRTVEQAKAALRRVLGENKPAVCPCCEQGVRVNKRSVNSGHTLFLYHFYKLHIEKAGGWTHVKDILERIDSSTTGLDYAILKHFGLIIQRSDYDKQKGWSGYWRLTQEAIDFIVNGKNIPKYALVYNGNAFKFSEELTDFKKASKNKFNLQDLKPDGNQIEIPL